MKQKRHWRRATWAIIVFSALMLGLGALVYGRFAREPSVLAFSLFFVFDLWFIGFLVLGVMWLVTRPGHT